MVNALIPDLPFIAKTEIDHIIQYLSQLHFLRGFETIYVYEKSLVNEISLSYVKEFPEQFERDSNNLIGMIIEELDSILWNMKKTDHMEANLTPFISLCSLWLKARSIRAAVIFSRLHPSSPVLYLSQVLTNARRNFIGNLAEDVELWFFSHFADVHIQVPFFTNFPHEIQDFFQRQIDINELYELLNDLCKYPTSEYEWKKRSEILSKVINYGKLILRQAQRKYENQIVITSFPIALSNESLRAFEQLPWNYPALMALLQNILLQNDRFNPYFILDSVYPRELLQKFKPLEKISLEKTPLFYIIESEFVGYPTIELAHRGFLKRLSRY
jgi:hypothetical protein